MALIFLISSLLLIVSTVAVERVILPDGDRAYLIEMLTTTYNEISTDRAQEIVYELENFYTGIRYNIGADCGPPKEIDKAFHLHIINTRSYAAFSEATFGYFLHHSPFWSAHPPSSDLRERCSNQASKFRHHGIPIVYECLWTPPACATDRTDFENSNPLWSVFDKANVLLNDLRSKKHILSSQLDKMMPKWEKVQLAYLYFIPKPHKAGTPLRPILSSMNMPTTRISKFLDELIPPIFDKLARSTRIIHGVDSIHRLEAYAANGYLKQKTYLCTFDITDLYTMLPQEKSLDILIPSTERRVRRRVSSRSSFVCSFVRMFVRPIEKQIYKLT
ncbi:unnamed protein product [Rotaria socialis]|uniref:Reverse transcriptase domain-containing protein n=1 Tax=Rotaria socialis TaxID=392032 RepID=A0A817N577_9BILA|nr:unnamed protein product [Rotaria socialis]CAF3164088.1 unnamed protein product [Rotaria socialis]CAF3572934.1 unnamed protein product [Rotaria socialis]